METLRDTLTDIATGLDPFVPALTGARFAGDIGAPTVPTANILLWGQLHPFPRTLVRMGAHWEAEPACALRFKAWSV
jgi:hypothetical protein